MTVDIPTELQPFVRSIVDRGDFGSETEVVRAALRLYQEREQRIKLLRGEIQPALDRLDRGEGIELDVEDIKARGRRRLASKSAND